MILTAYCGAAVYFLFSFKNVVDIKSLLFSGLSSGLALGIKSSALLVYPIFILIIFLILKSKYHIWSRETAKYLSFYGIFLTMGIVLFSFPAGYLMNYKSFGHPLGPKEVREVHSFEGKSATYILSNGLKNLLRYSLDFISLDGMPESVAKIPQYYLRVVPTQLLKHSSFNIESTEGSRTAFSMSRLPSADENSSYWGILGFAAIWLAVFVPIFGLARSPSLRILSAAAILFFIIQAFSGPYDPWRGRYFIIAAIFAVPVLALVIEENAYSLIYCYLTGIVLIGCFSAISSVLFRHNNRIFSYTFNSISHDSIFKLDRISQLTRENPNITSIFEKYEELVPKTAKVAICLHEDSYEYPFFGEKLTRTILPINSFIEGLQEIPKDAQFLVYSDDLITLKPSDIHLGGNWYLRSFAQ
jgi:hypothetical protein